MQNSSAWRWIVRVALLTAGLMAPVTSLAQGCAMCYNNAAAARAGAIHALRSGILVLLVPPMLIFGTVCGFAFRNRDRFYEANTNTGRPDIVDNSECRPDTAIEPRSITEARGTQAQA